LYCKYVNLLLKFSTVTLWDSYIIVYYIASDSSLTVQEWNKENIVLQVC
jgi:hypothetical protein